MATPEGRIHPSTCVGRIALVVADLDSTAAFYRDVVGLEVQDRDGNRATLGAGGTPLVELRADPDAPARGADEAGLFHTAFRVPTRAALGDALERVRDQWRLSGASDHLVSEALYLADPEGNGVEIYRDRPRADWPRTDDGSVEMDTLPLDLDELRAARSGSTTAPDGTDVGHVHLEVTDIDAARGFYVDALGLGVRRAWGDSALFVAAGEYHHHVGLNTWNGRSAPASGRGLDWFELVVPDDETLAAARERLRDGDVVETTDDGFSTVDPDGIGLILRR
jgi:catechol 2,3-dioxygenase